MYRQPSSPDKLVCLAAALRKKEVEPSLLVSSLLGWTFLLQLSDQSLDPRSRRHWKGGTSIVKPNQDLLQVLDQTIARIGTKETLKAGHGGVSSGEQSQDILLSSCTVLISLSHADDRPASFSRSCSCGQIWAHFDEGHRRRTIVAHVDPRPFSSRAAACGSWIRTPLP